MKSLFLQRKLRFLTNIDLREKALLVYSLFLILPLIILSLLLYYRSVDVIGRQLARVLDVSVRETRNDIENTIDKVKEVSDIIFINENIQQALRPELYTADPFSQVEEMREIEEIINNLTLIREVDSIRFFVADNFIFANQKVNFFPISEIRDDSLYYHLEENYGRVIWLAPYTARYLSTNIGVWLEEVGFSAARIIKDFTTNRILGAVFVDSSRRNLQNLLVRTIADNQINLLTNEVNEIITSYAASVIDEETIEQVSRLLRDFDTDGDSVFRYDSASYYVFREQISDLDWTLLFLVPTQEFLSYRSLVRQYVFIALAVIGFLFYFTAYNASEVTNQRIRRIITSLTEIRRGNFNLTLEVDGRDEIGGIEEHINYMIEELVTLMQEKYTSGAKVKSAELRTLQAQINPHFLYNSLDLINWLAIDRGAADISRIVRTLSDFYKLSLSRGEDSIPLQDELKHAMDYLEIQNKRFDDCVSIVVDIPDKMKHIRIPKITLQPIIENSLFHGILEKENQRGEIRISGCTENGTSVLTVEDDGIGIDPDTVRKIFSEETTGFGLKNIQTRFKLLYGEQYGLTISTGPHGGTRIQIRFPY